MLATLSLALEVALATRAMACSPVRPVSADPLQLEASPGDVTPQFGMSASPGDVGMSASPAPEPNMCNGMITIVRAVGVHPKIQDPFLAAAFACLLMLLLDL